LDGVDVERAALAGVVPAELSIVTRSSLQQVVGPGRARGSARPPVRGCGRPARTGVTPPKASGEAGAQGAFPLFAVDVIGAMVERSGIVLGKEFGGELPRLSRSSWKLRWRSLT
jgi:hypothetical protein